MYRKAKIRAMKISTIRRWIKKEKYTPSSIRAHPNSLIFERWII